MRAPLEPQLSPVPAPGLSPEGAEHRLSVDRADAILVEELIADASAEIGCAWAQSMADAERKLTLAQPDCILLDLNLPDANGIDALQHIRRLAPDTPIE